MGIELFAERLKTLRTDKDYMPTTEELYQKKKKKKKLAYEDIASIVGVGRQTVINWEKNGIIPEIKKFEIIADEFQVRVPWLMGYDNAPREENKDHQSYLTALGFSARAFFRLIEARDSYIKGDVELHPDDDNYELSSMALTQRLQELPHMKVINLLLENCENKEGEICFPAFDAILNYLTHYIDKSFYKLPAGIYERLSSQFPFGYNVSELFSTPPTKEELNSYNSYYSFKHTDYNEEHDNGNMGNDEKLLIDLENFDYKNDKDFQEYLHFIRVQKYLTDYIFNSSPKASISDIEEEHFYKIRKELAKLKLVMIDQQILEISYYFDRSIEGFVEREQKLERGDIVSEEEINEIRQHMEEYKHNPFYVQMRDLFKIREHYKSLI